MAGPNVPTYSMDGVDWNSFYNSGGYSNPDWSQVNGGAGYTAPAPVTNPGPSYDTGKDPSRQAPGQWLPSSPAPQGAPIPVRSVTSVPIDPRTGRPTTGTPTSGLSKPYNYLTPSQKAAMIKPPSTPLQNTVRGGKLMVPSKPTAKDPWAGLRGPAIPNGQQRPGYMTGSTVANIPPPPSSYTGSSTGNQYQIGKTYTAAGYNYLMTPNGPVNVGRSNPALTPAQTYAAASAPAQSAGNGTAWQGGVPGAPGYTGGGINGEGGGRYS